MCPANRVSGSFYSATWRRSDTFRAVSTPTRPTTRALRTQGSEGNPAYTGGSGLPRFRQTRAVFGGDNCRELVRQLGPPGGDVEVVVYSGSSGFDMDSTWSLRVFTLNGLLSREIHLGCIDFRDPAATTGGGVLNARSSMPPWGSSQRPLVPHFGPRWWAGEAHLLGRHRLPQRLSAPSARTVRFLDSASDRQTHSRSAPQGLCAIMTRSSAIATRSSAVVDTFTPSTCCWP
jgi:hypothetical protein